MRAKELNNGRMAMFAIVGIFAAEIYTGRVAVEQLGWKAPRMTPCITFACQQQDRFNVQANKATGKVAAALVPIEKDWMQSVLDKLRPDKDYYSPADLLALADAAASDPDQ